MASKGQFSSRYGVPAKINGRLNPAYQRAWRAGNNAHVRNYARRFIWKRWGLNVDEAQRIYEESSTCSICQVAVSGQNKQLDHNHNTFKIRGVLCGNCNTMIGLAHERPEIFSLAVAYLGARI